ncbi:hypothetical protein M408DRAFT_15475 [Serendipita vermifera MAFF 305830]|uniref:Uncharacterized protein n=1 Tax=Serendipita vermifera MAFF 305830 TaxID=933852 RepID=A0A0C3BE96_SERVB|nr:hypothetical protein M408DRAFT_15475 [Serendipita vermifera MAFF 305830]
MPLFRSSRAPVDPVDTAPAPVAPVDDVPARRGSLFSRRRRVASPVGTTSTTRTGSRYSTDGVSPTTRTERRGLFGRRRSSSSSSSDLSDRRRRGVFGGTAAGTTAGTGFFGSSRLRDPTLDAARGKVNAAELAEREADKALVAARSAVVEAKRHVQILEDEANAQAKLAQQKVLAARGIKGDASHLGRHN